MGVLIPDVIAKIEAVETVCRFALLLLTAAGVRTHAHVSAGLDGMGQGEGAVLDFKSIQSAAHHICVHLFLLVLLVLLVVLLVLQLLVLLLLVLLLLRLVLLRLVLLLVVLILVRLTSIHWRLMPLGRGAV